MVQLLVPVQPSKEWIDPIDDVPYNDPSSISMFEYALPDDCKICG
jgi:hypothetical protein